ncbi:MAG: hypothetical protein ACK5XN_00350 [Bacteroidota bacterium]
MPPVIKDPPPAQAPQESNGLPTVSHIIHCAREKNPAWARQRTQVVTLETLQHLQITDAEGKRIAASTDPLAAQQQEKLFKVYQGIDTIGATALERLIRSLGSKLSNHNGRSPS